jgi:hypothetical protein
MRWKWLGVVAALLGIVAIPAFTLAAHAATGLVAQSSVALAPGVTYTSYLSSNPRNVINVTHIAPGASVVIKAVPAAADGHSAVAAVMSMCQQVNAVACVNGDFFNSNGPLGGELVDGRWLRSPTTVQQQLWVDTNNRFSLGSAPPHAVQSLGATAYAIVQPGQPISIPEQDSFASGAHARTLIGWNAGGDRFLVTVEQGSGSAGMSLAQAANVMVQLGATTAVNEDGGASSQMVAGGAARVGPGQSPRLVANIWAVVAVAAPPAPRAPATGTGGRSGGSGSASAPAPPDLQARPQQWVITPHR